MAKDESGVAVPGSCTTGSERVYHAVRLGRWGYEALLSRNLQAGQPALNWLPDGEAGISQAPPVRRPVLGKVLRACPQTKG
jgi:hypothetical protein